MITPWEIYWVLQLDSIGGALLGLTLICGFAALGLGLLWGIAANEKDLKAVGLFKKLFGACASIFIVAFIANALLPSTKTAAAMIVVPQIVNSPTIQHEAGDLYNLAKEALRDAIASKPERKQ